MKLEIKRLHGRALGDGDIIKPDSPSSDYGAGAERDYGWVVVVGLTIVGFTLATISWTGLVIFLVLCAGAVALLIRTAIWGLDHEIW
jgi:hypothetical protein